MNSVEKNLEKLSSSVDKNALNHDKRIIILLGNPMQNELTQFITVFVENYALENSKLLMQKCLLRLFHPHVYIYR